MYKLLTAIAAIGLTLTPATVAATNSDTPARSVLGLTYNQDCPVDLTNTWRVREVTVETPTEWALYQNGILIGSGMVTSGVGEIVVEVPRLQPSTAILKWDSNGDGTLDKQTVKASGPDLPADIEKCTPTTTTEVTTTTEAPTTTALETTVPDTTAPETTTAPTTTPTTVTPITSSAVITPSPIPDECWIGDDPSKAIPAGGFVIENSGGAGSHSRSGMPCSPIAVAQSPAPQTAAPALPATGNDSSWLVLAGGLLLAVGVALAAVARGGYRSGRAAT